MNAMNRASVRWRPWLQTAARDIAVTLTAARPLNVLFSVSILLAAAGCASAGSTTSTRPVAMPRSPLLSEEIVRAGLDMQTAYDAVQRLRPSFFFIPSSRLREAASRDGSSETMVVVDGVPVGGIRELTGIPVSQVASIRLLSHADAFHDLGTRARGWVILVETRKTVIPNW